MMMTTNHKSDLIDRPAIRFLMEHHFGRLETYDAKSREVFATQINYTPRPDGSFGVMLPIDEKHAKAIENGGATTLTVQDTEFNDQPLFDEDGLPTTSAIAHVCMLAKSKARRFGKILEVDLQICDLQVYLRKCQAA